LKRIGTRRNPITSITSGHLSNSTHGDTGCCSATISMNLTPCSGTGRGRLLCWSSSIARVLHFTATGGRAVNNETAPSPFSDHYVRCGDNLSEVFAR
jgi:hypothetical protein